jgi:hypothetical protein
MDNSFRQQGSDTQQQPGGLLASLKIFNGILNWLAGLIQLTEEEQKEAGIQLGDPRYK